MYNAYPRFVSIIYWTVLYPLLSSWYVIIMPMYIVHSYFSLKSLGKKHMHCTWQNMVSPNVWRSKYWDLILAPGACVATHQYLSDSSPAGLATPIFMGPQTKATLVSSRVGTSGLLHCSVPESQPTENLELPSFYLTLMLSAPSSLSNY